MYCFTVINVGDTHLNNIVLDNDDLGFVDTTSIGQLPPGAKITVPFQTAINGKLVNHVEAFGNPIKPDGTDLPGIDDVMDTDPSEVDEVKANPSIEITNKVYVGKDSGELCDTGKPVEKVEGYR